MSKKINIIIWIVAICAVMIAAYTFYSKNKPQNLVPSSQETTSTSQTSISSNPIAPDFTLKDLEGKDVKLSDYKGKIVILNFWAVWCKYCKEEMPDLNELNKELEKDNEAVIITVDSQESPEIVKDYISSNNLNLKVLLDQDGSVTQTYGITGFPTTFIINRDGTLYTYIPQMTHKEELLKILDKIKNGEPANRIGGYPLIE
ncbi:MAG TPA: TlpA disulfide reductase family protein [Ruminiclostridium sp.]